MRAVTIGIVVAGIGLALALGIGRGFDATSVTILVFIVAVGAAAIGVADRTGRRAVGPVTCDACGGVLSPNAPFCKHCGARRS